MRPEGFLGRLICPDRVVFDFVRYPLFLYVYFLFFTFVGIGIFTKVGSHFLLAGTKGARQVPDRADDERQPGRRGLAPGVRSCRSPLANALV